MSGISGAWRREPLCVPSSHLPCGFGVEAGFRIESLRFQRPSRFEVCGGSCVRDIPRLTLLVCLPLTRVLAAVLAKVSVNM